MTFIVKQLENQRFVHFREKNSNFNWWKIVFERVKMKNSVVSKWNQSQESIDRWHSHTRSFVILFITRRRNHYWFIFHNRILFVVFYLQNIQKFITISTKKQKKNVGSDVRNQSVIFYLRENGIILTRMKYAWHGWCHNTRTINTNRVWKHDTNKWERHYVRQIKTCPLDVFRYNNNHLTLVTKWKL